MIERIIDQFRRLHGAKRQKKPVKRADPVPDMTKSDKQRRAIVERIFGL